MLQEIKLKNKMEVKDQFQIVRPDKITKNVSAKGLVQLIESQRSCIHKVNFVPPKLGDNGMGYFHVIIENGR